MHNVLILPGGGCFCTIMAELLRDRDLSFVNTIGGCSGGGILTLSYASGRSTAEVADTYASMAAKAFKRRFISRINPLAVKYDRKDLDRALEEFLGFSTLGQSRFNIFINTYDRCNGKPKVYSNLDPHDTRMYMRTIAAFTSAAPSFLTPVRGMIDGGWWMNDPTLTTAWGLNDKLGLPYRDMNVLVVNPQQTPRQLSRAKVAGMNRLEWGVDALNSRVESNEEGVRFGARHMGFGALHAFHDPPLPEGWTMDDPSNIPALIELARKYRGQFDEMWKRFTGTK